LWICFGQQVVRQAVADLSPVSLRCF